MGICLCRSMCTGFYGKTFPIYSAQTGAAPKLMKLLTACNVADPQGECSMAG
jgi:hypothetical protein